MRLDPSCIRVSDLRKTATLMLAQSVHPTIVWQGLRHSVVSMSLVRARFNSALTHIELPRCTLQAAA